MGIGTMKGALDHLQGVERGDEDSNHRRHGDSKAYSVSAKQRQKFAHEIPHAWQANGCNCEKHDNAAHHRRSGPKSAEAVHFARVGPFLQSADQHEQRASTDAVSNHDDQHSLERDGIPGKDADQGEPQMADAGVGHQPLQVRLSIGKNSAVDDSNHSQQHGNRSELVRRAGEERHHKTQHSICTRFQQESSQDHAACRGRLSVGVRQPGMEWKHRQLDGEGNKETQHQQHGRVRRQRGAQQILIFKAIGPGNAMMDEVKRQNSNQHNEAADLGEDEKFDGGVDAALVPPDRNQEVHGHQHQFPHEVKKEEVHREEDAHDAGQDPHQIEVEKADALLNLFPGSQHGHNSQQEREHNHQQAQPVHRQMEMDAVLRYPGPVHLLEPLALRDERDFGGMLPPKGQGNHKINDHRRQRNDPRPERTDAPADLGENAGHEQNRDEPDKYHKNKTTARKMMEPAAIPAAYHRKRPVSVLR